MMCHHTMHTYSPQALFTTTLHTHAPQLLSTTIPPPYTSMPKLTSLSEKSQLPVPTVFFPDPRFR